MKRMHAFLLILLMLTVPLQALAGQVALCQSLHAAPFVEAAAMPHALAPQMSEHGHHEGMHHASPQVTEHQADGGEHAASAGSHGGACSVCASCPMGAIAITIKPFYLPSTDLPSAVIAYSAFHIPDAVPELPDNPPRA